MNIKKKITLKNIIFLLVILVFTNCKEKSTPLQTQHKADKTVVVSDATGFSIEKLDTGITLIKINSPWPDAKTAFTYALVPKHLKSTVINEVDYDAVIPIPVERMVITSTTHIPALEALGVENKIVGFPGTAYVSSKKTRKLIDSKAIVELGSNEVLNTEMTIALQPEVIVGFSISNQNKAYETLQQSNIPVVYNGDWTEATPLGKAEWIKFFAPFFEKETLANEIFTTIKTEYEKAKALAQMAETSPTVVSGAMYKDVWYLPSGKSWAAQFIADAHATYLWKNTTETGSLSLSWETVLDKGKDADFWIGPAQFTTYKALADASKHYEQFDAFKNKNIFTFANTKGATGGLLYYELAPQRPDLVLKDLIHILHPTLLPNHKPFFFKPLK